MGYLDIKNFTLKYFPYKYVLGYGQYGRVVASQVDNVVVKIQHVEFENIFSWIQVCIGEINAMSTFESPYLMSLIDWSVDCQSLTNGVCYIAMPQGRAFSLDMIDSEISLQKFTSDLISAIHTMHTHHVGHKDIHSKNLILIDGHICLTDFGLAGRGILTDQGTMIYGTAYPVHHRDPCYYQNELNPINCDLYALGIVLWIVSGNNERDIINRLISPRDLTSHIDWLNPIIQDCVAYQDTRPSIQDLASKYKIPTLPYTNQRPYTHNVHTEEDKLHRGFGVILFQGLNWNNYIRTICLALHIFLQTGRDYTNQEAIAALYIASVVYDDRCSEIEVKIRGEHPEFVFKIIQIWTRTDGYIPRNIVWDSATDLDHLLLLMVDLMLQRPLCRQGKPVVSMKYIRLHDLPNLNILKKISMDHTYLQDLNQIYPKIEGEFYDNLIPTIFPPDGSEDVNKQFMKIGYYAERQKEIKRLHGEYILYWSNFFPKMTVQDAHYLFQNLKETEWGREIIEWYYTSMNSDTINNVAIYSNISKKFPELNPFMIKLI